MIALWIVVGLGAYGVGSFPTAQVVGRRMGRDPTREGSGNPGATNVYRTAGRRAGVVVGVVDVLKGAVPVSVGYLIDGRPLAAHLGLRRRCHHVVTGRGDGSHQRQEARRVDAVVVGDEDPHAAGSSRLRPPM